MRAVSLAYCCFVCLLALAPARVDASSTLIFIGGHGGDLGGRTVHNLQQRLASTKAKDTVVVFTGDYLSSGEFPKSHDRRRRQAEDELNVYVDATSRFIARGGRVYFLPGRREYQDGRGGIRRLRRYLNDAFSKHLPHDVDVDVMPVADCGEPHVVELSDIVAVALLNSPWWMHDWESEPKTNQGCELKSRAEFSEAINGLTKGYRTRRLVLATHHPLDSYGRFGGNFPLQDHLKPPLVGTIAIWARQSGLVPGYRNHVMVDSYRGVLHSKAQTFGHFVFASGSDRSQQVLEVEDQLQLISGHSGVQPTWVAEAGNGEFTRAMSGWIEVRLDQEGEGSVFVVGDTGDAQFQRALPPIPKLAKAVLPSPAPFPRGKVRSAYTKREIEPTSLLQGWIVGNFYRDAYALELDFDTLNIDDVGGGLIPVSIGGGSQTNSIRFVGPNGTQWAARATTKDSTRYLPYPLNRVPTLRYFLEEGFTGIHPSAATTVPALASALGLLHTEPRLLYLPDQEGIGRFRGFISDEVVLLERRPKEPKTGVLPGHLGGGLGTHGRVKYKSTSKLLRKLRKKPWKHRLAQDEWLRARLLDLVLGDWDRHQDQWRFARIPQEDGTYLYRPIPRDRDQACAHYDGLFLAVARQAIPEIRRLRPFDEDIGDLTWLTYNARNIDALFMNTLTYDQWMAIAEDVEGALNDHTIARGMATWPAEAYLLHGEEVERKLRSRRDQIVKAARRFFQQVNGAIEVLGSESDDLITLTYQGDAMTLEIRRRDKDGSPFFQRTFVEKETREVRIFALDGRDSLRVSGHPNGIRVRFLGGPQKDRIETIGAPVSARSISVYDSEDTEISPAISVRDERSGDPYRNQYDFDDSHHEPTRLGSLAALQFNADDGVLLGWSGQLTFAGFKRRPFASSHKLSAAVATTTAGARLGYAGLFPRTLGSFSQEIRLDGTTPLYTRNFFGFTSRFVDPEPTGRDFFRVREGRARASYGIRHELLRDTLNIGVRALGEYVDVQATEGRFVVASPQVNPESLSSRVFAGGEAFADYGTLDNPVYAKRGAFARVATTVRTDVTTGTESNIGTSALLSLSAGTFVPFGHSQRVVLATRFKYAYIFGDFPFFFAPTLGDQDLRAFNDEQLSGNGVFSQTTDLRLELLRFKAGLPGSIGFAASVDHGLAFGDRVASEKYNWIVGGSAYWEILDLVGVRVSYHRGLDAGSRFTVGLGRLFPLGSTAL